MKRPMLIAAAVALALSPVAVAMVLSSCVEQRTAIVQCGPTPLAPGWAVSVTPSEYGPLACMSADDFGKIILYRYEVDKWSACIERTGR